MREHPHRAPSYEVNTDAFVCPTALAETRGGTLNSDETWVGYWRGERDIGEVNAFVTSQ